MNRPVLALLLAACAAPAPRDSATRAPDARYLALGDSFTAGTGATPDEAFPARLVVHWGCSVTLENLGVNGYTTDDLIDDELPELKPFAPQLVTLAIGANDIVHGSSLDRYRERVRRILGAIALAGVARVVALPQPDWSLSPAAAAFGAPDAIHGKIVAFNAALRAETERAGGVYVDLFPEMEEEARAHLLASDGLHPSRVAYDAWGARLAKEIAPPCAPVSAPRP